MRAIRSVAAFAFTLLPCTVFAATAYVAVPMGSLGGVSTYGTAINARGQVAGFGDTDGTGAPHRHAFLFSNGVITNLGTFPGGTQSFAYSINDLGQVSGSSNAGGVPQLRGALFQNGTVVDLTPVVGGTISNAYGINNHGDLAGGTNRTGRTIAYVDVAGVGVTDLGTLGGVSSQAFGINSLGHVTGSAHTVTEDDHAFRYDGTMHDLGTLGGQSSIGNAINAADHVVGQSALTGTASSHAFLHDGTRMYDLGVLGGSTSNAHGINSSDTIVGESLDAQGVSRAFVARDGIMVDLNTVTTGLNGAVLSVATAINDSGQIVAMSCTGLLVCPQAFRLDPVGAVKGSAIEYHHAAFDHYFITANPDEIAKLDSGQFVGWSRTGDSFNVWVGDQVGTNPVCRFFSTAFDPKSSHFYTPYPDECVVVQGKAEWQFEGRVFNVAVPDTVTGACAAGTQPVYRLYNQGKGAAPNHRYTTSLATRATMINLGWVPEGYGPLAVEMCAPT